MVVELEFDASDLLRVLTRTVDNSLDDELGDRCREVSAQRLFWALSIASEILSFDKFWAPITFAVLAL